MSVGAAAVAAGSALALGACAPAGDEPSGLISEGKESDLIDAVQVPASKVVLAQDFDEAPFEEYLTLQFSMDLPLGSLVHQIDDDSLTALALIPNSENVNKREIAFVDLSTTAVSTIVKAPIGAGKNIFIYDARASKSRLAWVEIDLGDNSWSVYVVPLTGTVPGEALKLDEGDVDYEPPMLAVHGDKVYWSVMPMAAGAANQEDTYLRAVQFDPGRPPEQARPFNVLVSHGRMITNPTISDGIITVTPRVNADLVYYQLTALDCANDRSVGRLIMPPSLRVSEAICFGGRFAFSIERNYAYADGLANFGTYFQMDNDEYLHFARTPMSPVAMFKDCLIVKSTANIVGVDYRNRKFFAIELPERCSDFGEALAGWGTRDRVVTSSIRLVEGGGAAEAVMVRVFA